MAAELAGLISAELLADTATVTAELVGNAIRHARPLPGEVIRVAWRLRADGAAAIVEVRVTDGGAERLPAPRVASPDATDGRGLAIVATLALRWGVERDGLGQCVWAELGGAVEPVGLAGALPPPPRN
jgi:anti-sigma regulatory factor (Ser/Thr protein kinase)